jgi:hypothetical protein
MWYRRRFSGIPISEPLSKLRKLSLVGSAVARLSQGHLTPTRDRRALPLVGTSTIITSNTGINSRLGMGGADLQTGSLHIPMFHSP